METGINYQVLPDNTVVIPKALLRKLGQFRKLTAFTYADLYVQAGNLVFYVSPILVKDNPHEGVIISESERPNQVTLRFTDNGKTSVSNFVAHIPRWTADDSITIVDLDLLNTLDWQAQDFTAFNRATNIVNKEKSKATIVPGQDNRDDLRARAQNLRRLDLWIHKKTHVLSFFKRNKRYIARLVNVLCNRYGWERRRVEHCWPYPNTIQFERDSDYQFKNACFGRDYDSDTWDERYEKTNALLGSPKWKKIEQLIELLNKYLKAMYYSHNPDYTRDALREKWIEYRQEMAETPTRKFKAVRNTRIRVTKVLPEYESLYEKLKAIVHPPILNKQAELPQAKVKRFIWKTKRLSLLTIKGIKIVFRWILTTAQRLKKIKPRSFIEKLRDKYYYGSFRGRLHRFAINLKHFPEWINPLPGFLIIEDGYILQTVKLTNPQEKTIDDVYTPVWRVRAPCCTRYMDLTYDAWGRFIPTMEEQPHGERPLFMGLKRDHNAACHRKYIEDECRTRGYNVVTYHGKTKSIQVRPYPGYDYRGNKRRKSTHYITPTVLYIYAPTEDVPNFIRQLENKKSSYHYNNSSVVFQGWEIQLAKTLNVIYQWVVKLFKPHDKTEDKQPDIKAENPVEESPVTDIKPTTSEVKEVDKQVDKNPSNKEDNMTEKPTVEIQGETYQVDVEKVYAFEGNTLVAVKTWKGKRYIDVRKVFANGDPEIHFTSKGIMIDASKWEKILPGILDALANELGISHSELLEQILAAIGKKETVSQS